MEVKLPLFFTLKAWLQRVKAAAPPPNFALVCELPQAGGMGGWGVCRLIATHVVSSDLTSHIPAQEDWGLRWRGRGLEGAGLVGIEKGGTKKLEPRGCWEHGSIVQYKPQEA